MECRCVVALSSLIFLALVLLLKQRISKFGAKQRPPSPPGPKAWPLIGNILDLGTAPHQTFYNLSFKYGPLIWLRLGSTNTLVIQSAKAAEQFFKNHDINFSDRKVPECWTALRYNQGSLSLCRYGSNWRFLRRAVTAELMAIKRINESYSIRQKCLEKMIEYIEEDVTAARERGESGEVVVGHYVFVMAFNLMGNLTFSKDLLNSKSKEGVEFYSAMDMVMKWGGKPNIVDFFPFLKVLDPQRVKKNMEQFLGKTMNIVERFVKERMEEKKLMKENESDKDFLDAILKYEGPEKLSTHRILIIILEMFFGGTETTGGTIEWAMAELFRKPESMKRVKEELNRVVGAERKVEENDIDKLPYLQAVIKETMRLHPLFPLLIPRNTLQDTNFMGYEIPKETQVFVNVWAIGRDPDAWKDPLSFNPERFLGSNIDYKGQNFEFLPFGSGRRICAGIPLAHRVVHFVLASLLHCFEWELGENSAVDTMDMKEKIGFTVRKLKPVKAIPKKKTYLPIADGLN